MAGHVECYACDWDGTIPVYDRWAECPDCHLCGFLHRKSPDGSLFDAPGEEDRWACMKQPPASEDKGSSPQR